MIFVELFDYGVILLDLFGCGFFWRYNILGVLVNYRDY